MIIFDLDGTLLDVSRRFYRIYADILDRYGYEKLPMKDYWDKRRNHVSTADIIRETCPADFVPKHYEIWNRWFESPEYLNLDRMISGVRQVLDLLVKDFTLYLVTLRSNRNNLLNQLKELKLKDYFFRVLSGDRFGDWSVKSRLIQNNISGCSGEDWIVGDTEIDILAGKELRIRTCAVSTGIRNRRILSSHHPDFILEDLRVLPDLLHNQKWGHGYPGRPV